jgi:drug/metabolite transporter (DMT)-like permease
MQLNQSSVQLPGVPLALGSAVLFGAAAPLSKLLLTSIEPQMLAGLLYLGAGLGLVAVHIARAAIGLSAPEASLRRHDLPWLAAVVIFGGILGPVFLLLGLGKTSASSGSLMLNLESLATMGIAWLVFRENVDRRLLVGALAIVLGAMVLSWEGQGLSLDVGAALIAAACLCWGIDNNLTRNLSSADPVSIAMVKGLVAGTANIAGGFWLGNALPSAGIATMAAVLGFIGIGVSLVLFVLALRHLGTARTGAYFSLAPFIGALIALGTGDPFTPKLAVAALLMGLGLWLHLTERHEHEHVHEALAHEHRHVHDEHHQHHHDGPISEPHSHWHEHKPLRHKHPHYPDLHHRHGHERDGH